MNWWKKSNLNTPDQYQLEPREFASQLASEYNISLRLHESGDDLRLDHIVVPQDRRKQGVGSEVMNRINDYADARGRRVILDTGVRDPSIGTTSGNRLKRFYRDFGFTENKGRNKDFEISENMYRDPNQPQSDDNQQQ